MLQLAADWLVYSLLGFSPDSRLGGALNFFVYDAVKILLLLFFMIAVIGFFRSYISQDRVKEWISGKKWSANVLAALLGSVTPFCSCSSIPIFLSFLEAGIPLGVTLSFLITSPLINEYLVIVMLGFFGWKITLLYILSGILIGVTAGLVLGRMGLERHLVRGVVGAGSAQEEEYRGIKARVLFGINEARAITGRLWMWVLLGVGIGAVIHNYVPEETVHGIISRTGSFSVPLATALGVPMYGSAAAIVPVAVALFKKGVPLGTAMAFMMATAALSFPEAVILRRAMKLQLIAVFFGVTAAAIVLTGYLFNFFRAVL